MAGKKTKLNKNGRNNFNNQKNEIPTQIFGQENGIQNSAGFLNHANEQ